MLNRSSILKHTFVQSCFLFLILMLVFGCIYFLVVMMMHFTFVNVFYLFDLHSKSDLLFLFTHQSFLSPLSFIVVLCFMYITL